MSLDLAIFLATSGHSGVDRAAKHLVPALAARGYTVDVLQVRGHGPHFERIPDRVRLIDLGSRHVYTSLPALVRYLRRERPAALLSDKYRVNNTALLARALARTPIRLVLSLGSAVSVDLGSRGPFDRWLQRMAIGRFYRYADQVIVTSDGVADDMASYTSLDRAHIRTVPSPVVPASLFTETPPPPDHPWFAPGEPPVILGVGELCSRKDFRTLIAAFARIRSDYRCRLMILGRGRMRDDLLAFARTLGVAEDLALPGFVPKPYAYMAHARLFAFTSRWEGLGFSLIEALAAGTPAVSTDCPSGPREILQDGRYGTLVPVGDVEALSAAILATLANPLPSNVLREAAHPYEIENATDAYVQVLGMPTPRKEDGNLHR